MLEIAVTLGAEYRVSDSSYRGIASEVTQRYRGNPVVKIEREGADGTVHFWEVPIGRIMGVIPDEQAVEDRG